MEYSCELVVRRMNNIQFAFCPMVSDILCIIELFRISLLAYSPLAMGILSGKYFSPDGGPADARLNIFKGQLSDLFEEMIFFFFFFV